MRGMENAHLATLKKRGAAAPLGPGIYRWLDQKGTVLYVGKAKSLRKRVAFKMLHPQVIGRCLPMLSGYPSQ